MHRRLAGQTYFDGDLLYFAEAAAPAGDPPAKTDPAPAKTEPTAQAGEGTATTDGEAQPGPTGTQDGQPAGEGEGTPTDPTPTEQAIAAQRKADAVKMANRLGLEGDFEDVDAVETALAEQAEAARLEALDAEVSTAYTNKLRTIIGNLAGLKSTTLDANDNEVETRLLTDEQIQELVAGPINGLQTEIRHIERDDSFNVLADAVVSLLPDDAAIEKWAADVGGGKPIGPWMAATLEHLAPHTKWGKQQAADREAYGKKQYDEGVAFGAGAPKGTISQQNTQAKPAVTTTGKSVSEIAAAMLSGDIDFAAEAAKLGAHA